MAVRKGFVHMLETTFVSILILTFILYIIPTIESKESLSIARDTTRESLKSLDQRNILRPWIYNEPEELLLLKQNISSFIPVYLNFTVGTTKPYSNESILSLNEVYGSSRRGNFTYTLDKQTTESPSLEVAFTTSDTADFYLNGILLGQRNTSTLVSNLDLGDSMNGTNTLSIVMPSQQDVSLRFQYYSTEKLEETPTDVPLTIVSYYLTGNVTYQPKEVRVYLWAS